MNKILSFILASLFLFSPLQAAVDTTAPNPIIQEQDGSPSGRFIRLKVTNGTLTDNGGGTFSINTGGGAGAVTSVKTDDVGVLNTLPTIGDVIISIQSADATHPGYIDALQYQKVTILSTDVGLLTTKVTIISNDINAPLSIAKGGTGSTVGYTVVSNDISALKANRVSTDAVLATLTVNTTAKIPNGANPTVSAAGAIAVDTTATSGDALRFYGDAQYSLPAWQSKSFTITNPTTESDYSLWRVPYNITTREFHLLASKGTSSAMKLLSCDVNGLACVVFSATLTSNANVNQVDTTVSPVTINKGAYISCDVTAVTGSVSADTGTIYYTVNAVN